VTVLRNIGQLATCPADAAQQDAGLINDAAFVFEENRIVWVGCEQQYLSITGFTTSRATRVAA
jgi:hypothetical protein